MSESQNEKENTRRETKTRANKEKQKEKEKGLQRKEAVIAVARHYEERPEKRTRYKFVLLCPDMP